ncbi:hypothetical protein Tco_1256007 [Tanacetum coccineum]
MHNNIMAAGSKDRPPMHEDQEDILSGVRMFLRNLDTKSNVNIVRSASLIGNKLNFQAEKEAYILDF